MPAKPHSAWFPIVCLLLAATLWGIFWYPLRLLEENGIAGLWAAFFIFAGAMVVGLPFLWRYRQIIGAHYVYMLVLAAVSGWCNVTFFLAILEGNVVRVLVLFYLSPVWAVLLGRLLLGERLTPAAWLNLAVAIVGALIMLWEPGLNLPVPQSRSDWLAISSGFAFALANVLTRLRQDLPVTPKTVSTWYGGGLLALSWILLEGPVFPHSGPDTIAYAMLLGALGIVVMTLLVQYGVTHMPVHRSSVILLSELIAGAVSAQLLTNEAVRTNEWIGGALILLAGWLAAVKQKQA